MRTLTLEATIEEIDRIYEYWRNAKVEEARVIHEQLVGYLIDGHSKYIERRLMKYWEGLKKYEKEK